MRDSPLSIRLVLLALGGACTSADPSPPREDSFSVPSLEYVGVPSAGEVAWSGARYSQVALSGAGALALVDGDRREVAVIDPTGRLVFRSRTGSGPGEITAPIDVAFAGNASLWILDVARRLVVWDLEAGHRATIPLPPGNPTALRAHGRHFVVRLNRPGVDPIQLLVVIPADSPFVAGSPVAVDDRGSFRTCTWCPLDIAPDGTIAMAARETTYAVAAIATDGATQVRWERTDVPAVELDGAERDSVAARWEEAYRVLRASGGPEGELPPTARFKRRFMPHGVRFDSDGSLWLQREVAAGAPATFDVYSAAGGFRGTVVTDVGFRMLAIQGERMLGARSDTNGEDVLLEYRIVQGGR